MISFRLFYYITILFLFTQMAFSNTLSLTGNGDDTWNVNYISDEIIAGFQFNVEGAIINSASGGDAAENGFMISSSTTTVLGFSLTGGSIPPGEGVLLVMELSGIPTGLSDIIVSDPSGTAIDFTYDDGSGCMDETACNYDLDVTQDDGSCEYAEDNYDCGGNCISELDECGICAGDGSSCAVYIIDVLYNSDTNIAGFQLYLTDFPNSYGSFIAATGTDRTAGFQISSNEQDDGTFIVVGFDLTLTGISQGTGPILNIEYQSDAIYTAEIEIEYGNETILSSTTGTALEYTASGGTVNVSGEDPPPVFAPENLEASGGLTMVTLTWTHPEPWDVASYNVYRDGVSVASNLSDNAHTDTGLENNVTYTYSVSATYSDGEESDQSGSRSNRYSSCTEMRL